MPEYAVLFVCTGNICRSPTAHGVLVQQLARTGLAARVQVDSAGTHGYHHGDPPDERSQAHAARRGYDLSTLRARQVTAEDFETYDLILAPRFARIIAERFGGEVVAFPGRRGGGGS